jgi:pimeloyl-ACP methyl ester carboxylesterase
MDASLWEEVVADLSHDHRCVAPTLPLGAHRHGMRDDADLSPRGLARLVSEFLDGLDLNDVTLVGNDTGGALAQLVACDGADRVRRIVLVSCDAFDNFPPGVTGKTLVLTGKFSPTMLGRRRARGSRAHMAGPHLVKGAGAEAERPALATSRAPPATGPATPVPQTARRSRSSRVRSDHPETGGCSPRNSKGRRRSGA